MKKASITEAKNNLSALIDSVKSGSAVLIVDRGRPVARLEPVAGRRVDAEGHLARLIREGVVRPGRNSIARTIFTTEPPKARGRTSGLQALLEERENSR